MLRAFYLELRAKAPAADGAPITTRQLESLIRLTEARARADLRTTATQCASTLCTFWCMAAYASHQRMFMRGSAQCMSYLLPRE